MSEVWMSEEIKRLLFPLQNEEEISKHWQDFVESRRKENE